MAERSLTKDQKKAQKKMKKEEAQRVEKRKKEEERRKEEEKKLATDYVEQLAMCNVETDTLAVILEAYKLEFITKKDLNILSLVNPKVTTSERRRMLLKCAQLGLKHALPPKYASESETEALAAQALRQELIKRDVFDHLSSLHSEIPYSLRHRYLLQFLYQPYRRRFENLKYFKKRASIIVPYSITGLPVDPFQFAKDAERDGLIDKCVLDYLSSLYPEFPTQLATIPDCGLRLHRCVEKKMIELRMLPSEFENPITTVLNTSDYNIISPEQLSKLNELLVNYAYNWKNIGIALNFQPQDLQNIQASPLLLLDAPKSYLARLLEDWLLRKLKHTLPLRIDCLKQALNSQTVGLGSLSKKLENKLLKSTFKTASHLSYCSITFESKNETIYVQEGWSTLLEILASDSEGRTYQWLKDGKELIVESSTMPIFCLHQAGIDWDGCKLICIVKPTAKAAAAPTITINVSCELDQFRRDLASMYLAQSEVPEDTWPPVANLKYINLALVKQETVNYNSEYARLTIRGDVDDVLQDKQIIAYNNIEFFRGLSSGKLVLIEGRPGSGKTTFVHKLTQDWAVKSGGSIRLLMLVSLRVLNTFTNPDLSDILKLFKDLKVSKNIIEQRSGKGVCFIFDGFDEFSPRDGQSSVVHKIIDKTYLHHSIVIVASRPAAIAKLRNKASSVIEVVGFLSEQVLEYFNRYPFSTTTKSAELKVYLKSHPNIFHMCYLPIHATMVAFLFQEMGKVPTTETEIYTHFTRFTLIRNLTKNREFEPVNINLHSLTGEESLCFKQICQLAFKKTLSSEQVLYQNEVSILFQVKRSIDSSLGLITIDRTAGLYGYKNIYTFMHLTFQEYLAAYHITTLSDEEQMKLIQEYGDRNHMLVVWKFYCGLTTIKVYNNKFKTILHKSKGNTLFQIQCGYETQQKIACAQVLKEVCYHFKLEDKYLSTPDFTALGYVTNITVIPTKLSLLNCNMNVEAIDALLSEMEDGARGSVHALHTTAAVIDNSQIECISKLLANLKSLKSLSIEADSNEVTGTVSVSGIKLSGLTDLSLKNVDISSILSVSCFTNLLDLRVTAATEWQEAKILKCMKVATNLQLLEVAINMEHFELFCECAQNWRRLKNLVVTFQESHMFFPTLNFLGPSKGLEMLEIKNCIKNTSVAMGLMVSIKEGLEQCLNIQKIYLSYNSTKVINVDSSLFERLSVDFVVNLSLKELQIDSFHIADSGAKLLSSKLQYSSSLVKLSLPSNKITSRGCLVLAANLHYCTKLEKLDLEDNDIGTNGALAIVCGLKHCRQFQELNLSRNPCHSMKTDQKFTFLVLL